MMRGEIEEMGEGGVSGEMWDKDEDLRSKQGTPKVLRKQHTRRGGINDRKQSDREMEDEESKKRQWVQKGRRIFFGWWKC